MLSAWSGALSPFARERSAITTIAWQEWAHPVTSAVHVDFLESVGIRGRRDDAASLDYLALVDEQAPVTIAHDVLVTITADLRKIRTRRSITSRFGAGVETLMDEVRLFAARLDESERTVAAYVSQLRNRLDANAPQQAHSRSADSAVRSLIGD